MRVAFTAAMATSRPAQTAAVEAMLASEPSASAAAMPRAAGNRMSRSPETQQAKRLIAIVRHRVPQPDTVG